MAADPYRPPTVSGQAGAPPDPDDAVPGWLASLAGVTLVLSGSMVAGSGLQMLVMMTLYSTWLEVIAWLLMAYGSLTLGLGGLVMRARDTAAFTAAVLSGCATVLLTIWLIFVLYLGLFSPILVFGWLFTGLATVVTTGALPGIYKTSRARRSLYNSIDD